MKNRNYFVFFCIFLILLAFNYVFPPQSDDIIHHITAKSNQSFFHSYFTWNGRIGEILYTGCLALINDSFWFDVINSFVGTIFIFIFFFLIFARLPKNKLDYLSFVLMCGMIVNMYFADIFLWGAGSLNYLWGIGLILLFLIPYRIFWGEYFGNVEKTKKKNDAFWCLYLLLISFFAGWASEHIGITLVCLLFLSCLYAFLKKIKLPMWYYIGAMCFMGGWLILFFSPGSANRAMAIASDNGFIPLKTFFFMGLLEKIRLFNETLTNFFKRGFIIFYCSFLVFFIYKTDIKMNIWRWFVLIVFALFSIVIARHVSALIVYALVSYLMLKLIKIDRRYWWFLSLFAVWILIALTLLQLRGDIAQRARLGDGLILGTLMILMFRDFYQSSIYQIFLQRGLLFGLAVSIIACFCNWAYVGYNWKKVKGIVEDQKAGGAREVVIPKELFYSYYSKGWGEPGVEPNWINLVYAKHFGVDKFIVQ